MIDESINITKKSRLKSVRTSSEVSNSLYSNSIGNLNEVLEQLLETFRTQEQYVWGKGIYKQFKKHFRDCFE